MEGDEYLEKIAAESYAREIDQEENVYRTLPFAAAVLAIIFAFMAAIRSDLPTGLNDRFSILVWTMLILFWVVIAVALGFLWAAIAAEPLLYLSPPSELREYMTDLRDYYTRSGTPPNQIEPQVVEDMRALVIEQYAYGVTHNQRINARRLRARSRAFLSLIAALLVALEAVVFIFGHKLVHGGADGTIAVQQSH